ncbi:MAG: hypothetical protein ACLQUT_05400 [Thermoleophilia bacterium]
MSRSHSKLAVFVAAIFILAFATPAAAKSPGAGGGGGHGGGETAAVNSLSFPAIALDGFAIAPLTAPSFTVPYKGDYPGLTQAEIDALLASGPWFPQQTVGNTWQARFAIQVSEAVTYIDWGDNIESINPKIRAPFRLEVTLYKHLLAPMTAYTMAVLENPSSSTELQGTNASTYDSAYATVVSARPNLVIQYVGANVPADMTWDAAMNKWISASTLVDVPVSFAPELNVAGKYVFGASEGGWKPDKAGYYRITFYSPNGSGVDLTSAIVASEATGFASPTETGAATPRVDATNNLTYVDVHVVGSGGGGRK